MEKVKKNCNNKKNNVVLTFFYLPPILIYDISRTYCCCCYNFLLTLRCYTSHCRHFELWHPSYNLACSLFRSHYSYDLLCGNRYCFVALLWRFKKIKIKMENSCLINELVKINGDFFGAAIMSWRQIATISMLFIWQLLHLLVFFADSFRNRLSVSKFSTVVVVVRRFCCRSNLIPVATKHLV